jgi:ketosteroid isomerase-like protein
MKRFFILIAVLLMSTLVLAQKKSASSAKGKAGGDAQATLEQMEKDRAQAVVKKDTATLEKMTADDYQLIDANGKMRGKADTMDAIKSGAISLQSNDVDDLKVQVYGNTAVVTGRSNPKGTIDGKDVSGPIRFTRVYVKRNGTWQSVLFQQTRISQ